MAFFSGGALKRGEELGEELSLQAKVTSLYAHSLTFQFLLDSYHVPRGNFVVGFQRVRVRVGVRGQG